MAIMQVGVVACLGMKKAPGRSADGSRKQLPERVLSWRGLIRGKGKMVIFIMVKHRENGSIGTSSMRLRSGRWIHLIRSLG